ncbi:hypothetical protein PS1_007783 [Malus domestica]
MVTAPEKKRVAGDGTGEEEGLLVTVVTTPEKKRGLLVTVVTSSSSDGFAGIGLLGLWWMKRKVTGKKGLGYWVCGRTEGGYGREGR